MTSLKLAPKTARTVGRIKEQEFRIIKREYIEPEGYVEYLLYYKKTNSSSKKRTVTFCVLEKKESLVSLARLVLAVAYYLEQKGKTATISTNGLELAKNDYFSELDISSDEMREVAKIIGSTTYQLGKYKDLEKDACPKEYNYNFLSKGITHNDKKLGQVPLSDLVFNPNELTILDAINHDPSSVFLVESEFGDRYKGVGRYAELIYALSLISLFHFNDESHALSLLKKVGLEKIHSLGEKKSGFRDDQYFKSQLLNLLPDNARRHLPEPLRILSMYYNGTAFKSVYSKKDEMSELDTMVAEYIISHNRHAKLINEYIFDYGDNHISKLGLSFLAKKAIDIYKVASHPCVDTIFRLALRHNSRAVEQKKDIRDLYKSISTISDDNALHPYRIATIYISKTSQPDMMFDAMQVLDETPLSDIAPHIKTLDECKSLLSYYNVTPLDILPSLKYDHLRAEVLTLC